MRSLRTSLAFTAIALPLHAQVLQSSAIVTPAISFGLFEFHPGVSPPVTQSGQVNANTVLWALTTLPGEGSNGASNIEITHPAGSSLAQFAHSMQRTPGGDELVLQFDWLARCFDNPPSPFGFYGAADVSGGCLVHVASSIMAECGVVITATLDGEQAPDTASIGIDVGDDSSIEVQGNLAGPVMSQNLAGWTRVPLRGGLLPIRIVGHAHAETDGGHRTVTVHVEIRVSPAYAASLAPLGGGCSAGAWTPALGAQGASLPQLGSTLMLEVNGLPPEPRPVIGLVGTDTTSWLGLPLPLDLAAFGMPGCMLQFAPLDGYLQPLLATGGSASWPFPIPAQQSLLGFEFFVQALVEAPGANAFGAVTTNACRGIMGA